HSARIRSQSPSSVDRASDQNAEQPPALVVEAGHLDLLDRNEIGRADRNAGQQHWHPEVVQMSGLLHDVCRASVRRRNAYPTAPVRIGPNSPQRSPLTRAIWTCLTGAKSVGLVLPVIPGNSIGKLSS